MNSLLLPISKIFAGARDNGLFAKPIVEAVDQKDAPKTDAKSATASDPVSEKAKLYDDLLKRTR